MKVTKFYPSSKRKWILVDAKDKVLGRLATRIAKILQGKTKPTYSPNFISGDYVVVINAEHMKITGRKYEEKVYDKYSGYPGGRKTISFKNLMKKNPSKILYLAIRGMLPKNKLRKKMLRMLKIYPENKHPHFAQSPERVEI
ncbi:MAG: 50S ribosomal protein L13 [Candidatus Omnitrophica bacterium 4484_70.2]|nr:MAG: 50S ribosomal protein L13 [Candidatus Omnitrophica bacterium 4484_70.2]